jgi:hypothetical protein
MPNPGDAAAPASGGLGVALAAAITEVIIGDLRDAGGSTPRRYRSVEAEKSCGHEDGYPDEEGASVDDACGAGEEWTPPYMTTVWLPGDEPTKLPPPPMVMFRTGPAASTDRAPARRDPGTR